MCTRAGAPARSFTAQPTAAAVTQTAAPAAPAAQQAAAQQAAPTTYGRMPMSEAAYMAQQMQQAPWNAATRSAIQTYLQAHAVPGSLYSPSQILNNALRKGLPLTAAQQRTMAGLDAGMHALGYNANMTRYDRVGFMDRLLGGQHYWQMSEQQLKSALIGKSYVDNAYVSASHNRFINAPRGNNFQDKAVEVRIHAKGSTRVLMPGTGPGGDFGEMILARGQRYKIVDVKMPQGQTGRSGASYYQKVVITLEVE